MAVAKSYYELLGVPKNANLQTLKKAFYSLSKALHPDTSMLPADEAEIKFRQVCEAYELLSDPTKRKYYDQYLKEKQIKSEVDINLMDLDIKTTVKTIGQIGNRRPLSGGELFSLMMLGIAVFISLLLAIVFAVLDGKELQVTPSWLQANQSFAKDTFHNNQDVNFTLSKNTFGSTFFERT